MNRQWPSHRRWFSLCSHIDWARKSTRKETLLVVFKHS